MDCSLDEYLHSGQCYKCLQCPPGQELKEDCGYGLGVSAKCGVCDVRWFKESWGSHPCALCQNCRRLNRHQIKQCTHTDNAVCGNCLPGFYSKKRVDGLEDLECLPCGPEPFRNTQCSRGDGIDVVKIPSSPTAPQNGFSLVTACAATAVLTTILFVIICATYRTRTSLRKTCKRCLSSVSRRHNDSEAVSVPMTAIRTMMQETETNGSCLRLPLEDLSTHDDFTQTMTSDLHQIGSEALFLVQTSARTDLAPERPESSSSGSDLCRQPVILALVGGKSTVRPCCAVEQRAAWGFHAPVECTELDLENLSSALEDQTSRPLDITPRNSSP